jgi:hypothetical protein
MISQLVVFALMCSTLMISGNSWSERKLLLAGVESVNFIYILNSVSSGKFIFLPKRPVGRQATVYPAVLHDRFIDDAMCV